jgi:hypothetical protein
MCSFLRISDSITNLKCHLCTYDIRDDATDNVKACLSLRNVCFKYHEALYRSGKKFSYAFGCSMSFFRPVRRIMCSTYRGSMSGLRLNRFKNIIGVSCAYILRPSYAWRVPSKYFFSKYWMWPKDCETDTGEISHNYINWMRDDGTAWRVDIRKLKCSLQVVLI